MTFAQSLVALAQALSRLAAPAGAQVGHLTSLGVAPMLDELALEFDDAWRPSLGQLEEFSSESAAGCCELDEMLSRDDLGWTFKDLDSPAWDRIRSTAGRALAALQRDAGKLL